jgi:hypothetical protein
VLILGGAALMALFFAIMSFGGWSEAWWTSGHGPTMDTRFGRGWFVLVGLVAGGAVLGSGLRMKPGGPGDGHGEGIVAIVGSVLSFPEMGRFLFGAPLGVVGGALSLATAARDDERPA